MLRPDNIMFNAFKHHAGFIKRTIAIGDHDCLFLRIRTISDCQLDFYYGSLSPESISEEVIESLCSIGVTSKNLYREFLEKINGYHVVELNDHSTWILRWGTTEDRFIHLHPARHSPHTLRVAGGTLKTVIAVVTLLNAGRIGYTLDHINTVRSALLDLPPVKKLEDMKAVERVRRLAFFDIDKVSV